jgi:hypothetical protein
VCLAGQGEKRHLGYVLGSLPIRQVTAGHSEHQPAVLGDEVGERRFVPPVGEPGEQFTVGRAAADLTAETTDEAGQRVGGGHDASPRGSRVSLPK